MTTQSIIRTNVFVSVQALVLSVCFLLFSMPSHAQVVAYKKGASFGQRVASNTTPIIAPTPTGASLIHIATPNARGVSHNRYQQFDVTELGAILNNSASASSTHLGGVVAGNPNMSRGQHAGLIINEVINPNASALRGKLEVAGPSANVIVANPNGIQVFGGSGFINTSRVTLTTGKPVFTSDGDLSGLRVQEGKIDINAGGLHAAQLDQLDLIARSIRVNDTLKAKALNIVAGANQVNYADLGIQVIEGVGQKPALSIDSRFLGGMYAQRIALIGTERGVGVNLDGNLIASGSVSLDVNGNLTLTGNSRVSGPVDIKSSATIDHRGTFQHTGNGAFNVTASSLNNQRGQFVQDGSDVMTFLIDGLFNNQSGTVRSAAGMRLTAGHLDNSQHGSIHAQGKLTLDGTAGIDNTRGSIGSGSQLDWEHYGATFNNTNGQLMAAGPIFLGIQQLNNTNGQILSTASTSEDPFLSSAIIIDAEGGIDNSNGTFISQGDVHLRTPSLTGIGSIHAQRNASLQLEGDYTITPQHILNVQGNLFVTTTGVLVNQGNLAAGGDVSLQARYFSNESNATVNARNGLAFINTKEGVYNLGGIYGDNIFIAAPKLINDSVLDATGQPLHAGIIDAKRDIDIVADTVINKEPALIRSGGEIRYKKVFGLQCRVVDGSQIESCIE